MTESGSSNLSPEPKANGTKMSMPVARKVRFYRNGDKFHGGVVYAVSPDRYRTLSSLMAELTRSLADRASLLPAGVRFIFALGGAAKITSVDQLLPASSYVCASFDRYVALDYAANRAPREWSFAKHEPSLLCEDARRIDIEPAEHVGGPARCGSSSRVITVVRNGRRPRSSVRFLLNRRTARSLDQVMEALNATLKLDTGPLRRLYTMKGVRVKTLADLFSDEVLYIACGPEKHCQDDFELDQSEHKILLCNGSASKLPHSISIVEGINKSRARSKSRHSTSARTAAAGLVNGHKHPPRTGNQFQDNGYKTSVPSSGSSDGTSTPDFRSKSPAIPYKLEHHNSPLLYGSLKRKQNVVLHEISNRESNSSPHSTRSPQPSQLTDNMNDLALENDEFLYPSFISENYEVYHIIGDGNFAVVRECVNRQSNKYFALKIIDKSKCKTAVERQMIANEVSILRRISHPNIVQLMEEHETESHLYLVMELVKGGDLFDAIAAATKFPEDKASKMIFNLASAVRYLHSLHIVHRDIKPENLLVYEYFDGTKTLKLADFGLAIHVTQPLYTVCGTPAYVAPEILAETGYGIKIDVWAMGVITYILLCGFPPFDNGSDNQEDLFDLILTADVEFPDPYWYNVSDLAKDLIRNMLQVDPIKRYSALDVLMHPWILGETRYQTKTTNRSLNRQTTAGNSRASLSPTLLNSNPASDFAPFAPPRYANRLALVPSLISSPNGGAAAAAADHEGNISTSSCTSLHNATTPNNLLYT